MLFAPPYVLEHPVYRLQEEIELFVRNSIDDSAYGSQLFSASFAEVVDSSEKLREHLEALHSALCSVGRDQREEFLRLFEASLSVPEICRDAAQPLPATKDVLKDIHENVAAATTSLFGFLWSKSLGLSKYLAQYGGDLEDHYQKVWALKPGLKCPFCGLLALDDPSYKRNSYDHFIPKGKYPFGAINFLNLVPMCDKCNEAPAKGQRDPLHWPDDLRVPVAYPYDDFGGVRLKMSMAVPPDGLDKHGGNWDVVIEAVDDSKQEMVTRLASLLSLEERYNNFAKGRYFTLIRTVASTYRVWGAHLTENEFRDLVADYAEVYTSAEEWNTSHGVLQPGSHVLRAVATDLYQNAPDLHIRSLCHWIADRRS